MAAGMQLVTPGLVLREVKIGEADRILTVLTPELGVISPIFKIGRAHV